jgi:PAS domain S-box-containing protein
MRDRGGRLRGFTGTVADLTDRLRADALLAVLDSAPEAVLAIDEHGVITFANRAGRQLFGYPDAMHAVPLERVLPAMVREHMPSRPPHGRPWHEPRLTRAGIELDAVRRDGSVFLAELSLSSTETPRGRTVIATVRVADEHGGLPTSLDAGQFGQGEVGRAEATTDAVIIRANPALERLLGFAPGELVGVAWPRLVHPDDRLGFLGDLRAVARAGDAGWSTDPAGPSTNPDDDVAVGFEGECRLIHRYGHVVEALVAATMVCDEAGLPAHLVAIVLDNSDPRRARRQLLRLATRAAVL